MTDMAKDPAMNEALFNYVLGLGDDMLISGHRLSEWSGHAPILEEDIALSNIALDCLGQANALLILAGEIEGKGRTEDDLAYFRDAIQFRNFQMMELPIGDFAFTIARQFLFSSFYYLLYEELRKSRYTKLAAIASKSFKEIKYHVRHASEWMLRLGDGTEESHYRLQNALDDIWMYTGEFFQNEPMDEILIKEAVAPDRQNIKEGWHERVRLVASEATLILPGDDQYMAHGGRRGIHTEYLGHLLSEMQIVARSYPGAKW